MNNYKGDMGTLSRSTPTTHPAAAPPDDPMRGAIREPNQDAGPSTKEGNAPPESSSREIIIPAPANPMIS